MTVEIGTDGLAMLAVLDAARAWWDSKRPCEWTVEQHLQHPEVNTQTPAEGALARRAAELARIEADDE